MEPMLREDRPFDYNAYNRKIQQLNIIRNESMLGKEDEKAAPSREEVWLKFFKTLDSPGECWACGDLLQFKNMEKGHKRAKSKDGSNNRRNFVPLCGNCNKRMTTHPALEYIRKNYPSREEELKKKGWLK